MNPLKPAIVQNYNTGDVLMLGYMNDDALKATLETGFVTFFSRSRNRLWKKGETSGHTLSAVKIVSDCDDDALLVYALPSGPTCHTGSKSCFFKPSLYEISEGSPIYSALSTLESTVLSRKLTPIENSYTKYLFDTGLDKILKKVGEECSEVIIASKNDSRAELIEESADLLYHLMVLWAEKEIPLTDIYQRLNERAKK